MFEGGYSYGPRYLVPGIALLCLALGAALEAATPFLKKLAIGLFAAGVLVNAIGLATSFLEAQVGFYYDRFYNYQIDYSPITRQTSLFFRYLTAPGPAPIGQGFDRWWIILSKAGISSGTLWTIGSIEIAGLAIATWFLFSALKKIKPKPSCPTSPSCGGASPRPFSSRWVAHPDFSEGGRTTSHRRLYFGILTPGVAKIWLFVIPNPAFIG